MELLVLGGGPAGATAAMHARELGAQVTLVEANRAGGTSIKMGRPRCEHWPGRRA